ncbi:hypothetical protein DdX_21646 [Ditylenchus destructor]|uniref:Uncharacterized protein n=1 Tax=Ditylenchus destructor TaxID=166010 RepID=A0AAD4QVD4_9BILA|nr:hypothetical protein DdX_21646 [Ditylenchus destructor]
MGSHLKSAVWYAVLSLIVPSLMITFIHYAHNNLDELREMINDIPPSHFQALIIATAQREPSFVSYSQAKWTKGIGVVYIGCLTSIIIGEVVVITVMTYKIAKEIKVTKAIVRTATHHVLSCI